MKILIASRAKWIAAGMVLFLVLVSTGLLEEPSKAYAHESRDVAGGKYQFRVGFTSEPVYQGLDNAVFLAVCNGKCVTNSDGSGTFTNGVTGAFDTLKVEVTASGQSIVLPFVAVPRNPGRYNAQFIPTRVGDYTFRIFGTLGPDKIDEKFNSGPETFDSVQSLTVIQFPDKPGYPVGATGGSSSGSPITGTTASATNTGVTPTAVASAANPSPVDTSSSASSGTTSTNNDLQELRRQLSEQQQQLDNAKSSAATAGTIALGGIIFGIIGTILALITLILSRRKNTNNPREIEGG